MSVVFQSAEDNYRALKSQYTRELRRLRTSGTIPERDYLAWRDDGKLDVAKFPNVKALWDKLESAWAQTRAGMAERKASSSDSLIAIPKLEVSDAASPLDNLLLATLPSRVGFASIETLAASFNTDATSFLNSFRRVRAKLANVRAYECLHNGQLSLEIVENV